MTCKESEIIIKNFGVNCLLQFEKFSLTKGNFVPRLIVEARKKGESD